MIHVLNLSKPKIMFCSETVLDAIINVSIEISSFTKIIVINKCKELHPPVIQMADLTNGPLTEDFQPLEVLPDHTAAIFCSSGTTGMPKGVMLTHKNFHAAFYNLR